MSLEQVEESLASLVKWPKVVGCFGGEPTLHPDFEDICRLYQRYIPRHRAGLWTSGGPKYKKYERLINATFRVLLYNDHSEVGKHQPMLVGSNECIPEDELREELIDNCWLQKLWSPAINMNGAFFCEVAGALDLLFDMGGGYELTPDWWVKKPEQFKDQRDKYCGLCSIAIPFPHVPTDAGFDYVSPENYLNLLKAKSKWAITERVKVVNDALTRQDIEQNLKDYDYEPWEYLGDEGVRDKEGKVGTGYAQKRNHTPLA